MQTQQPIVVDALYQEFGKDLYRLSGNADVNPSVVNMLNSNPSADNSTSVVYSASDVGSGVSTGITQTATGSMQSGKKLFDNTATGYIIGVDPMDGFAKFYIGNTLSYLNWDGTTLTVTGGIVVNHIDIPDTISANSFHVDSMGNTWWGATTLGASTASVTNSGNASFSNVTILGGLIALGTTVQTPVLTQSFTANGAITSGRAIILGNGTSGYLTADNLVGASFYSIGSSLGFPIPGNVNTQGGQTFFTSITTTAIRAVLARMRTNNFGGGGGYAAVADIYAVDVNHKPTGSSLGQTPVVVLTINTTADYTFTWTTPIALSANTEYAIIFTPGTALPSGGNIDIVYNTAQYLVDYFITSAANVYTASAANGEYFRVWEVLTATGKVQHADTTKIAYSTDPYDLAKNFIGFGNSTVSAGASIDITMSGIDTNVSGLTPGITYYLSGSAGQLATSAGAVSVKVGFALTANSLFIKGDNYP